MNAPDAEPGTPPLEELLRLANRNGGPEPGLWLKVARAAFEADDMALAYRSLARVADTPDSFAVWAAAAGALEAFEARQPPPTARTVRVAIAGSYTTSQFALLLRLAALRRRIRVELYETGFDLYAQEILDPTSGLFEFEADFVVLAPHEGAIPFPPLTADSDVEGVLAHEVARWQSLWEAVHANSSARILQHTVVIRPESAWGHAAGRVPGSRDELLRRLNAALARRAGDRVLVVDCDRIAAAFGKWRWFDDRYWHLARQAVALDALPELARHTAAVLAAAVGLSAKCVALDLDNTLWGGIVGEDGPAGITLGGTPEGEAYLAFQEYLLALRARGVLLAVTSKNNEGDALEVFEQHPETRLHRSDFAAFIANWEDKPSNLRALAKTLDIGLEEIVFVDDNPVEREVVRRLLPQVEVVDLPGNPSEYVRALSDSLLFEAAAVTSEDLGRAEHYRAREAAAELEREVGSLAEFHASLKMEAVVGSFDELNLPRIAQLVAKTNQFNLTTRRHSLETLRRYAQDEGCIDLYLRLRDVFGDHGLVSVLIARQEDDVADIDTWLMSCRVIERTVEAEILRSLCEIGRERGISRLRGTFVPTSRNAVCAQVFARFGFDLAAQESGTTVWEYDIEKKGIIPSEFIRSRGPTVSHARTNRADRRQHAQ
jgi:FkbH-like protein